MISVYSTHEFFFCDIVDKTFNFSLPFTFNTLSTPTALPILKLFDTFYTANIHLHLSFDESTFVVSKSNLKIKKL